MDIAIYRSGQAFYPQEPYRTPGVKFSILLVYIFIFIALFKFIRTIIYLFARKQIKQVQQSSHILPLLCFFVGFSGSIYSFYQTLETIRIKGSVDLGAACGGFAKDLIPLLIGTTSASFLLILSTLTKSITKASGKQSEK